MKNASEQPYRISAVHPLITTRDQARQYLSNALFTFVKSMYAQGCLRAAIIDGSRAAGWREAEEARKAA